MLCTYKEADKLVVVDLAIAVDVAASHNLLKQLLLQRQIVLAADTLHLIQINEAGAVAVVRQESALE